MSLGNLLLTGYLVMAGAGFGLARSGQVGGSPACQSALVGWGGKATSCYPPNMLEEAEAQVAFSPLRPVAVVEKASGLKLSQVAVQTGGGVDSGSRGKKFAIIYAFGTLPSPSISAPVPETPRFLLVRELVYQNAPSQPIVDQVAGKASESAVDGDSGAELWQFGVGIYRGEVLLTVTANLSRYLVSEIGSALLMQSQIKT
jgi:hypothetical protein